MASNSGSAPFPKKRKLQLDSVQCQNLASQGSASLTNPTQAPSSSAKNTDPNKGLYPRKKKKKSHHKDHNNSSDDESYSQNSTGPSRNFRGNNFNSNPIQKYEFVSASSLPQISGNNFKPSSSKQPNFSDSIESSSSVPIASSTASSSYSIPPQSSASNWSRGGKKTAKPAAQKNNLFNYYNKDANYKPKLPSVKFSGTSTTAKLSSSSKTTVTSNSLNLGAYESSPDSSPTYIPEKLSLAVEISNCQNQKDEVIEISSDDSDELDNVGFFGVKNSKTAEIDKNNPGSSSKPLINFNDLPIELKEMIFGQLPLTTLLSSAALVCQEWNDIISDGKFVPWKKWYHKMKCFQIDHRQNAVEYVALYVEEDLEIVCPEELIFGIIKDIAIFEKKNTRAKCETNAQMIGYLKNHRKYNGALTLVKKEFPEVESDHDLNPYAIIAAIVVISDTFEDISRILQLLTHSKSSCYINDLLECFYYLACIFYYAALKHKAGKGIHYRLYYALYQYENLWFGTQKDMQIARQSNVGQQCIDKYGDGRTRLTNQQIRIINHELAPNQIVKIVAFAGTGKTSTLVEYTKKRPGLKFLNIVFNKSVCDQAQTLFPRNVECRTAHSLAYRSIDVRKVYKFAIGSMKPKDLERLNLEGPKRSKGQNPNAIELDRYRRAVLTTFETFINSADETVTIKHAPSFYNEKNNKIGFHEKDRLAMVDDATTIWKRMIDPNDFEVKMMHDGYLKLHQLRKPIYRGYDCILIDEAQDCNPAMLSIILNQKVPKIFVGDPNQQIYAFRGAVNALESIEHTHVYYLTQSFRFGPEIAYIANTILFETKKVRCQTLVGGKQKAFINQKHIGQLAILGRSNASLFKEAVRMICLKVLNPGEPKDIRGYFNGGTEGLKQLTDIYQLKLLEDQDKTRDEVVINDRFIQKFRSFLALKAYANAAEDVELTGKIRLVEQYKENIPGYVEKIVSNCGRNIKTANVVFSSVHKAKGMEFDTVMLADDFSTLGYPFVQLPKFQQNQEDQSRENELNILYVATTRAKKCLLLNSALYYILLGAGERFEYPIFHTDVRSWVCSQCDVTLDRSKLKFVLTRGNLTLANGEEAIKEGSLCQVCATQGKYQEVLIVHPDNHLFEFAIDMDSIQTVPIKNQKLFSELIKLE